MRLVSIECARPEAYLAKTIYDALGRVLLAKGTQLSEVYIKRLADLEYRSLYIEDDISESIEIEDIVPEETRQQVSKITNDVLISAKSGKQIEERKVKQAVNDVIDDLLRNREALVHLTEIRSLKDDTFRHSVNVCVLSVLTGISMGYHQLQLRELGIGALLHDVGKAKLPEGIMVKQILTEQEHELFQKHPAYGWEILKNTENVSIIASNVAFQHHERYDGSGYPRGLSDKNILEFARIVAIADVYDNLASDHPQRKRMYPHEIIEFIKSKQGLDFDPDIVAKFIPNIAPFPVGSLVLLNNGFRAIVVSVEKSSPTRPIIRLLNDDKGKKIERIKYLDLMSQHLVFITEIFEI